ncbi:L,D-transpeptidase family protein (plasmid) [Photobacterium sp. GJ3]|uniref:L,D-transpeptidase family protein n=1 Tax=Photobacterium sp. GJ3 TaxID=2829502 RepID=UPI001B8D6476|nr:L,D-transpeptidase family protein [Photobacterium sp. GJ3]QUJ70167.1 L,D-transpeptidase family protein [Photobacterium sp. GJ3]
MFKKIFQTLVFLVPALTSFHTHAQSVSHSGKRTVDDVLAIYGQLSEQRLKYRFRKANVAYPPTKIALLGLKEEKALELWAIDQRGARHFVHSYPVTAASGKAGPKMKEGDRQVPEGIYKIIGLNPNSRFHLSMKLNYPNDFDMKYANLEGRTRPGTNIFIHGKADSIGCLAIGDTAIEELFTLVGKIGKGNVDVVIAPHDPRKAPIRPIAAQSPTWVSELYASIETEFARFTY